MFEHHVFGWLHYTVKKDYNEGVGKINVGWVESIQWEY